MITKKLLLEIDAFDDKTSPPDYNELVTELDLLERVSSKLQQLAITARMKKVMADFGERDSDIYIVTYAKSGTTLMQMILYQLTTDGNMDFKHLYDVSPWCRHSAVAKQEMASTTTRRIIKTHDEYEMLENVKKGKFIVLTRDCLDVIPSFHQHIKDYIDPSSDINALWNRKVEDWFNFNTKWIANEKSLPILYVNYEDLVLDKAATINRIAQFMEIDIDDEIMERTIAHTSIEFMKVHQDKFGEQPENWKVYTNFIRNGKVGEGKNTFTPEQLAHYKSLSEKYSVTNTHLERYFTF